MVSQKSQIQNTVNPLEANVLIVKTLKSRRFLLVTGFFVVGTIAVGISS